MECTPKEYLRNKTSVKDRIIAIDAMISDLLLETAESISNAGVVSLSMDDGQMKVNTSFRSVKEVTQGIWELKKLKEDYINLDQGRGMVLRGGLNY